MAVGFLSGRMEGWHTGSLNQGSAHRYPCGLLPLEAGNNVFEGELITDFKKNVVFLKIFLGVLSKYCCIDPYQNLMKFTA